MPLHRLYEPSVADVAWCAGIVDGEGYISVTTQTERVSKACGGYPRRPNWRLEVGVNNTDLRMLRKLQDCFGGNKIQLCSNRNLKPGYKKLYSWKSHGQAARPFLEAILPYLICKKEQAEVALLFIDTIINKGPRIKTDDATLALRKEMFDSLRALKKEVYA